MRKFLAVMLMLGMAGTAFAGGGSKANGRIEVKNLGEFPLAVIVDPPADIDFGSIDAFEDAGGKVLDTNERHTFRVERGQQIVGGAYILGGFLGLDVGEADVTTVSVGSRKVKLNVRTLEIFVNDVLDNIGVEFIIVD